MKRILAAFVALYSALAFGATLSPVQLLNPSGSTAGQTIVSTGASSAPGWATVPLSGLSSIAANTVLANATASSAAPTAFSMPSCSTSSSALNYTTNTGIGCNTSINAATLGGSALGTSGATVPLLNGANTWSALQTFNGGITASGTLTGFPGRLLNVQVFSSSGTYTPTSGTNSIIVKVQAPGGGSGGDPATGAATLAVSGGGNGGSYAEVRYTSGVATQTVTIGAVGAAGAAGANAGGTGGTTSFGALISCPGGNGGGAGAAVGAGATSGSAPTPNTACTISGGTTINSVIGGRGWGGYTITTALGFGGWGANSYMGIGYATAGSAQSGYGYGGGAGGVAIGNSASAAAGATGAPGVVEVFEYQ